MRKARYNVNKRSNRKKNMLLGVSAVTLLVAVFFFSFVIAYNLMGREYNSTDNFEDESSMPLAQNDGDFENLSEVEKLEEEIKALNEHIEELNAEIEKYKAIAQMKSGSIPAATAPAVHTQEPVQTPKRTAAPTPPAQTPQSTKTPNPTPTPTPEPVENTPTPPPANTNTPTPVDDDGSLDGI